MENETSNWYKMEDNLLINLYKNHNLSFDELSKIHKRSNLCIKNRLIKLGVIEDNSNFIYKELVELTSNNRSINKITLLCQILSDRFKKYYKRLEALEKEISDLKEFKSLNEID